MRIDHLCSVSHRSIVSPRFSFVDLSWSDDSVVFVIQEFVPVSQPACDSWDCEEDREEVARESHSLVDDP